MKSIFNFPIELWLFQILIILFPILLYQAFLKKRVGDKDQRNSIIAILCGVSILLCMSFPVTMNKDFILDFRFIPLILSFLYGGFRIGFSLSIMTLVYRIFIGGTGIYLVLFIVVILVVIFYFTLNKFQRMKQSSKVVYSFGVLLFVISIYAFGTQFFDDFHLTTTEMARFIIFCLLSFFTMWSTIYLQEGLNELDILNHEMMEFEKNHLIAQISTRIAHEIVKPLDTAKSLLETLGSSKQLPLHDRSQIADSVIELDKVNKTLVDYLTLTNVPESEDGLLDVKEEIDSVISTLYTFAIMHKIEIKYFTTLEENLYVKGNKFQFRQAIINLVKNGMEACQNGIIEIGLHEMLSSILIVIEDNGTGMTKDQLNRLGDRLHSTKKRGTGLGVMVSYNIIGSMSGKVQVTSEQGKGTIFSITIPKATAFDPKTN